MLSGPDETARNERPDDVDADGSRTAPASPEAALHATSKDGMGETVVQGTSFEHLAHQAAPKSMLGQFGRYVIQGKLGEGGMGAVYIAKDTQLDRDIALKIPKFDLDDKKATEWFLREARSMATVHHPNLCPVYDVGVIDGIHYMSMAYIEGRPLTDYVKSDKPIQPRQVAAAVRKIAVALEEAHQAGIVHRDLKPDNIMINTRKEPVIMDFGLARRENPKEAQLTKTGQVMGTPSYMAPEQVEGNNELIGPCTDIYALGVIMYQMLCGELPFKGVVTLVLAKIITEEPPAPSAIKADVDSELERICLKAKHRDPNKRYQTAGALAKDLKKYLAGSTIGDTMHRAKMTTETAKEVTQTDQLANEYFDATPASYLANKPATTDGADGGHALSQSHPSLPAIAGEQGQGTPATMIGRYRLEKKVGEGSMGAIYQAVDESLNRVVALKVLQRDKAQNEINVKRFQSEARAAANLKHTNIVGVYDSGDADGYLYIAMEFVDGVDLEELMNLKGVLSPKRSLDIVKQVTQALQHAYERNIVHRDIKPSDLIIMRDGSIKVTDMGVARLIDEGKAAGITQAGTTVGTVDFMSPEQARDSRSVDTRSDIYSLGATWFYMLTGQPPFAEGDQIDRISAHAKSPRPNPQALNKDIPDAICQFIETMMAIEPGDRYQTPTALLKDLETANLSAKTINSNLLSALADEEHVKSPPRKRSTPKPGLKSSRRSAESRKPRVEKAKRSDSPPGVRGKEVRHEPKRQKPNLEAATETTSEERSTGSIPSARDAMLGGKRLRRSYREGGGSHAERGYTKIGAIVVGIIGLIIVAIVVLSKTFGDPPESSEADSVSIEADGSERTAHKV